LEPNDTERAEKKRVDESWKREAQQQKMQDTQRRPDESTHVLGSASFSLLISGLATQTLLAFGEIENPLTGKREVDVDQAKYTIDLLQILEEKTRGNLTEEEQGYLNEILYDLRMRYVAAQG